MSHLFISANEDWVETCIYEFFQKFGQNWRNFCYRDKVTVCETYGGRLEITLVSIEQKVVQVHLHLKPFVEKFNVS